MGRRINNLIGIVGLAAMLASAPYTRIPMSSSSDGAALMEGVAYSEVNKGKEERIPWGNVGVLAGGVALLYSAIKFLERRDFMIFYKPSNR